MRASQVLVSFLLPAVASDFLIHDERSEDCQKDQNGGQERQQSLNDQEEHDDY